MFKNTASQSLTLYAVDASTGLPKTGDGANMVFYVSKDDGSVTAIASASGVPTEIDATNAKGLYKIALSQSETNADKLLFSGKSSTSNIVVVPSVIYTVDKTGYSLSTGGIDALYTRALTESYNADGVAPTVSQALHLLMAAVMEFSISGTTITAKKLDGSTTAATFTLDDATNPTSRTRAT